MQFCALDWIKAIGTKEQASEFRISRDSMPSGCIKKRKQQAANENAKVEQNKSGCWQC
jgi:hypothetical protein